MKYFGIEIYDGKPLKDILIEENIELEEQWYHLTQDITCIDYSIHSGIDYSIHSGLEFSVDVGWYPEARVTPRSRFKTQIMEGHVTEGGIFFEKFCTTIVQLKADIEEAVELIQKFKTISKEKIIRYKIRE